MGPFINNNNLICVGNSSLYKQKYEKAVRDMEIMKRRIQQQHEEEMEQKAMLKKASDKRVCCYIFNLS